MAETANKVVELKSELRSRPTVRIIKELPVSSWTSWDAISLVKSAVRQLENGDFGPASQVIDAMGCDDRIEGVMGTRAGALPALPLSMEPRGDGRQKKMVAEEAEETFDLMFSDDALTDLMHWGRMIGIGVAQLVWDLDASAGGARRWRPKLDVLHPRYVRWRWDTRSYWMQTEGGEAEIRPGDGQWVLFTPGGYKRAWMRGLVRSLYVPWLVRQWTVRDWARYSEVHGLPIRKAIVPAGALPKDIDDYLSHLANFASDIAVKVQRGPSGNPEDSYDLQLVEAMGNSTESFDKLIALANSCVAIRILGQNLSTEVKGGSFAAAKGHLQIREDILTSDAELLAECLRQQALAPWAQYNFGSAALAPLPCWKTRSPDDKVVKGNGLKALGEGILALKQIGAKPDVDKLLEADEIPVTGKAEDVPVPPPGPKPGAEGEKAKGAKLSQGAEGVPEATVVGQLYADALISNTRQLAAEVLAPDLKALLGVIDRADSYSGLKEELEKTYSGLSRKKLAALLKKAMVLADLNGRHSVLAEEEDG